MWTVKDVETGFSINFREGLFNETQQVIQLDTPSEGVDLPIWAAQVLSGIGDYMALEHPYITTCDIYARRSALWHLSKESWWITIAAACNTLIIDADDDSLTDSLINEVEDFLRDQNPADLSKNDKINLLGAISLLEEEEAAEVIGIVKSFWWDYPPEYDTETWARELLWWPAYANVIIDRKESDDD